MTTDLLVVLCTCPSGEIAVTLARKLVESRLAACVNVSAPLTSIYTWEQAVHQSEEQLLIIKTDHQHYSALEQTIRESHPYQLPEIIALPISAGLAPYLRWVQSALETIKTLPA